MKKMSPTFPVLSILLVIGGAAGLIMDFIVALSLLKNPDCSKVMVAIIIVFGIAWSVAAIIAGIGSYKQAVVIIKKQRAAAQRGKLTRARFGITGINIRAILIVAICAVQMIFIVIVGVVIWQLLMLFLFGILVPLIYLISARMNA